MRDRVTKYANYTIHEYYTESFIFTNELGEYEVYHGGEPLMTVIRTNNMFLNELIKEYYKRMKLSSVAYPTFGYKVEKSDYVIYVILHPNNIMIKFGNNRHTYKVIVDIGYEHFTEEIFNTIVSNISCIDCKHQESLYYYSCDILVSILNLYPFPIIRDISFTIRECGLSIKIGDLYITYCHDDAESIKQKYVDIIKNIVSRIDARKDENSKYIYYFEDCEILKADICEKVTLLFHRLCQQNMKSANVIHFYF